MTNAIDDRARSFAPLPLRLMLGFGFLYHGYPKLFTPQGNATFTDMLAGLSVPAPSVSAYLIGGFEFVGGLLLVVGVAVRIVSTLGLVEMLFAAAMVHGPAGFNFLNVTGMTEGGMVQYGLPGYEVPLLYAAGFASLIISGAGSLAMPARRTTEHPTERPFPTAT